MTAQQLKAKKDNQSDTQEFLSGKLAQVDIARIEKELKGLWKSASQADGEKESSVTRACAMNLILFSEDDDAEQAAGDVLDEISTRHPCRAILAIARPSLRPSLEAWVSARCHLTDAKKQKQICCEQITVRGLGTSLEEMASVVLPLLIADLPVFIWWRAGEVNLHRVQPFLGAVDEIILDSSKHEKTRSFFSDVVGIINAYDKQRFSQVVISDLNWRRCLLWREAIALVFDEKHGEVPLAALKQISSIDIAYTSAAGEPSNQAILSAGWLASRLGWKLDQATKDEDDINLRYTAEESKIDMHLRAVECDGNTDICSVEIRFSDAKLPVINIVREAGAPGVQVHCLAGKDEAQQPKVFRVNQASESRLIDLELETCDRDIVLEAAYRSAAEITAALKK